MKELLFIGTQKKAQRNRENLTTKILKTLQDFDFLLFDLSYLCKIPFGMQFSGKFQGAADHPDNMSWHSSISMSEGVWPCAHSGKDRLLVRYCRGLRSSGSNPGRDKNIRISVYGLLGD